MPRLVREGLSADQAYQRFIRAGGQSDRATFDNAYAQVESSLNKAGQVANAPLNRRPTEREISRWTTTRSRGMMYHFDIFVQLKNTDIVYQKPYSIKYRAPVSWGKALRDAYDAFADAADREGYDEIPLGISPVAVYRMEPE